MFVAVYFVPLTLGVAAVVGTSSVVLLFCLKRPSPVSPARLLFGYLLMMGALLAVLAAWTYVSRADAARVHGVPPEQYASVMWNGFSFAAIVFGALALVAFAVLVAPVAVALARWGRGSVAWVLATVAPLSLLLVAVIGDLAPGAAARLVATNLLLAFSFALGLGLPLLRARPTPTNSLRG